MMRNISGEIDKLTGFNNTEHSILFDEQIILHSHVNILSLNKARYATKNGLCEYRQQITAYLSI